MSRIGKEPVNIPQDVEVTFKEDNLVVVRGPKGELSRQFHPNVSLEKANESIIVKRADDQRQNRALHGLARSLMANMVIGVSQGYSRDLEIIGVGFKGEMRGSNLLLTLGYSHQILFIPPEGIRITVNNKQGTALTVLGADKELVGDCAAKIRSYRKPEPYKGKGIRYKGEYVARKAGKTAK